MISAVYSLNDFLNIFVRQNKLRVIDGWKLIQDPEEIFFYEDVWHLEMCVCIIQLKYNYLNYALKLLSIIVSQLILHDAGVIFCLVSIADGVTFLAVSSLLSPKLFSLGVENSHENTRRGCPYKASRRIFSIETMTDKLQQW